MHKAFDNTDVLACPLFLGEMTLDKLPTVAPHLLTERAVVVEAKHGCLEGRHVTGRGNDATVVLFDDGAQLVCVEAGNHGSPCGHDAPRL